GSGGQLHTDTEAGDRQAVFDADRGHFFDIGTGDGGDGKDRAGRGEGGRRDGDRGIPADVQDGDHGCGDVQEVAGRRAGGRQRGAAVERDEEGRSGAGTGGGEGGIDHAAYEVQGRGVRADEGRRRTAHAVFQRIPAAVLLPDDGRDGIGGIAGRGGDGDAGR